MIYHTRKRHAGPVMQTVEERATGGFQRLEDVISREELKEASRSFKVAAGFDTEALNQRRSYYS